MFGKMLWQGGGRPRSRAVAALISVFLVCGALAPAFAAAMTVNVRIESPSATIYNGRVVVGRSYIADAVDSHSITPGMAISSLDEAARLGGFPYLVSNTSYGLFVESIDGLSFDLNPPYPGWMYRVNGAKPVIGGLEMGSDSFPLKAGDDVLWYYGTSAWSGVETTPAALRLSTHALAVDATLTARARQLDATGYAFNLPDATVHIGSAVATSNASGLVQIRLSRLGRYGVRVEKAGYVRSEVQYVKVAYPSAITGFAASKKLVRYGSWVALTGRLVSNGSGLGGRRIAIQQRPVGTAAWRGVAAVVTRKAGGFYVSLRPGRSVWYRAVWSGDASHLGAKSAQRRVLVWR